MPFKGVGCSCQQNLFAQSERVRDLGWLCNAFDCALEQIRWQQGEAPLAWEDLRGQPLV